MKIYSESCVEMQDVALSQIEAQVRDHMHFDVQIATKAIVKESVDYAVWDAMLDLMYEMEEEPIA